MAVRKMAVLDENGIVINTILVDERAAGYYHPGYGSKLVDVGPAENCNPARDDLLNFVKEIPGMEVVSIEIDGKPVRLNRGDRINLQTLEITPYEEPAPVVVVEEPIIDGM